MMQNVICYKTKEPEYYNKGTKYERSCDHFLFCYFYGTEEQAQEEAKRLNTEKPEKKGDIKIDWNKVAYFYVNQQEEMY